ncbi:uncharacterized membrane protein YjjB (DUF3815 family) [Anaerosolibacter carboniphilus]|uniref:Uncharacterized membrane protein YjjB (DUF3815 family) n=1 Tax=Anaerosolibacter carboniphilus TaxID=1417629 RepID=A0A841KN13_9FIRM|nr:threonine/serine exporter family protein [Anaerosolibacter carboniphilus]MBB6214826.1 uncharacterized membrane protein YjjB (DUF3815 family) [Anaerosolibacter carboniphilus]
MFTQFIYAYISTVGFSLLFNIPRTAILKSALIGATGWLIYAEVNQLSQTAILATFLGACAVSILSEIFARKFREAVTVFVIPGILPLVPGSGMYNTMLALIQKNFSKAALVGSETIFIAASIAVAILLVSSFTRLIFLKKI